MQQLVANLCIKLNFCLFIPIETEDFDGGVTTTPYNWPSEGIIEFKEVSFKYKEHLPPALQVRKTYF